MSRPIFNSYCEDCCSYLCDCEKNKYIQSLESRIKELERKNGELKMSATMWAGNYKDAHDQIDKLKARLAHVESELKAEQKVVDFYADKSNYGINKPGKETSIDPCDHELIEIVVMSGMEIQEQALRGGKRARQRIKERKEFEA